MGKELNEENVEKTNRRRRSQGTEEYLEAERSAYKHAVEEKEQPVRRRTAQDGAENRSPRRRRVEEEEIEERPVRRRRVEEEEIEERPVRRRAAVEEEIEERPVRRHTAIEEDEDFVIIDRKPSKRQTAAKKDFVDRAEEAGSRKINRAEKVNQSKKLKKKKKSKGPVIALIILLVVMLAALIICIWQLFVMKNGGDSFINQMLSSVGHESEIPKLKEPSAIVPETAAEEGSNTELAANNNTEPTTVPQTAEPTEPQTYQNDENGNLIIPERQPGSMETEPDWESTLVLTGDEILDTANRQAAMYDYDTAIATLQAVSGYESKQEYIDAIADYEQRKSEAVQYASNDKIPHVFFHTLVVDTSRAFDHNIAISKQDGVDKVNAYNYVMTTVDEFCRIMEEMYRRDYVLVSIYDVAAFETQEDGTQVMKHQPIYLPEGKKPFVLSVDDVSYYEYMEGHGFATKLIIGDDGKLTNEYVMADGSVVYGSYDVVSILDDFIETHPDFSYRGAKGIVALTGYEGIFGYRTSDYWYNSNCEYFDQYFSWKADENREKKQKMYYDNPNIEQDKQAAKQVAEALKEDGWLLASHTWGHNKVGDSGSYERLESDTMLWEKEVRPLVGDTDIILFPQGEDLYEGSWRGYDLENEKYKLLKSVGFSYFCSVDSNLGWTQLGSEYFRMGRANLDGQRMWEALTYYSNPESGAVDRLSTLFDSRLIFDWSRPTPVVN